MPTQTHTKQEKGCQLALKHGARPGQVTKQIAKEAERREKQENDKEIHFKSCQARLALIAPAIRYKRNGGREGSGRFEQHTNPFETFLKT